ncbi:MAG: bifunctional demethylmenaquinone methyltransferase/2-methoxy-6-polyprenyl-1,4-benzoquinol methylase UbiE [Candidatus Marinimicrobia bacterium]|nr:bifunctional demethylmenaquinone methyltransferase/2-methoxy-6-polyprenyl-1,4-benzoquinol methylase UbiE [Candidatus Neomarinimicrobiota bacterium]
MTEFKHRGTEKKAFVQKMFDDISDRYDFLNHLLSLGIDYYWRHRLVKMLAPKTSEIILDVATGTGDVGFAILKKCDVTVIGLDYAYNMTRLAKQKAEKRGIRSFKFVQGDGEQLPFSDNSFDAITIAFGFRNIGHFEIALQEFSRVLKPGGRLVILEFSQPTSVWFSAIFRFYFKHILPKIAALFARSDAYRYLPESVEQFPERDVMISMMDQSGFIKTSHTDLTFGVSTLYLGWKS